MKPKIDELLPSQAMAALQAYFTERLEKSALNFQGNPLYSEEKALEDFVDSVDFSSYERGLVRRCYAAARREYEIKHPRVFPSPSDPLETKIYRK